MMETILDNIFKYILYVTVITCFIVVIFALGSATRQLAIDPGPLMGSIIVAAAAALLGCGLAIFFVWIIEQTK